MQAAVRISSRRPHNRHLQAKMYVSSRLRDEWS